MVEVQAPLQAARDVLSTYYLKKDVHVTVTKNPSKTLHS